MYLIYGFLLAVGFILMLPIFLLKREKYAAGFRQRLGALPAFTPDARPVVWLHCVSVGETNAARPLVAALAAQFPGARLIVSTTTRTGQELARTLFADTADAVFYFPFDFKFSVRRALRHFRPAAVLVVETELWFNFLREASRSGARVALVNGRLSARSFRRYALVGGWMRRVLGDLDLALMQDAADAERLAALGAEPSKIVVTGNVKFDQPLEESPLTAALAARFGIGPDDPLVLAASTHAPEEKWLLDAFARLRAAGSDAPAPRLLIVPRHPERFDEVAELAARSGFAAARRSAAPAVADRTAEIVVLDSIGELRAVYPLAGLVFVGGSLIPHGGQSVLEPAAAARAIVTGPHTANFAAAVAEFKARDALVQLPETDERTTVAALAETFAELLADAPRRRALGERARAVMTRNRGATARTVEHLREFLKAGGEPREEPPR